MRGWNLSLANSIFATDTADALRAVPATVPVPLVPEVAMPAPAPDIVPGHIGLSVTDLGRSITFYKEVLDLELIQRSDDPGRAFK